MNNQMKYILLGLLVGGISVWLFMSTQSNSSYRGMMSFDSNSKNNTMQRIGTIDAHFIEQMIPHHEDAIVMAKLALIKAKRPEVKQLAQNIIDSQGKEIIEMRNWYKEWFGKEVQTNNSGMMGSNGMHGGMMGDASDMTKLEESGDFDTSFVEEMIPHHQMAVMMANMLKGGTERVEMQKLADDIIEAQNNEIVQMRGWLEEWK